MMRAVFAITLLLPERHTELREQRPRVLVGPGRGHEDDVHAADLVDLVVDDLREDELLAQAERVIAAAVEPLGRHALEVTDARQRDVHQPVEELVHPRVAQGDLGAGRHALAQLEVRDRLLRARHDGLLSGDRLQIGCREVHDLRVVATLADAHVDHDLVQPRHGPHVVVAALLHERGHDRLRENLLEARGKLSRALRPALRDGGLRLRRLLPARLALRLRRLAAALLLRLRSGLGRVCFRHGLASVDRLAAAAAGTHLAAGAEDLDAPPRGLVAPRAHDEHVGERQRPLALDDAALAQLLRRTLVLLDHVDVLDEHASLLGEHAQHLAALAPLAAGNDADGIAATNVNALHQMTSGAREMILVNCRSRSSRATGPKMRVPTGFSSALISTTALRSKRM